MGWIESRQPQCRCGRPVPHIPQELGVPVHEGAGAESALPLDANTENFFVSFGEPQSGHLVPFQSLDRTNTSLSCSQLLQ
jgi:hypothetical protein